MSTESKKKSPQMFDIIFPVSCRIIPTSHFESPKGLTFKFKLILVLYLFLLGGVNGIIGPIKL